MTQISFSSKHKHVVCSCAMDSAQIAGELTDTSEFEFSTITPFALLLLSAKIHRARKFDTFFFPCLSSFFLFIPPYLFLCLSDSIYLKPTPTHSPVTVSLSRKTLSSLVSVQFFAQCGGTVPSLQEQVYRT